MESPKANPTSSRELSRLAALLRYDILDSPNEDAFDDFTHLAAQICGSTLR